MPRGMAPCVEYVTNPVIGWHSLIETQKQGIHRFPSTGETDVLENTSANTNSWIKIRHSMCWQLSNCGNVIETCHDAAHDEARGKTKERRRSDKVNQNAHELYGSAQSAQRHRRRFCSGWFGGSIYSFTSSELTSPSLPAWVGCRHVTSHHGVHVEQLFLGYTQRSILRNTETASTHQFVSYLNAFPRGALLSATRLNRRPTRRNRSFKLHVPTSRRDYRGTPKPRKLRQISPGFTLFEHSSLLLWSFAAGAAGRGVTASSLGDTAGLSVPPLVASGTW